MERTERRERHYGRRQRSWGRPGGPAASSPQAACPTRGAQDQARESLTPRDHRRTFLPRKWKAYGFLDKATHMSATVGSISISNTDQSATARHSRGVNADLANPIHSIHAHAHAHVRLRRCIHIPPSPLLNPRPSGYLRRTVSYPPSRTCSDHSPASPESTTAKHYVSLRPGPRPVPLPLTASTSSRPLASLLRLIAGIHSPMTALRRLVAADALLFPLPAAGSTAAPTGDASRSAPCRTRCGR